MPLLLLSGPLGKGDAMSKGLVALVKEQNVNFAVVNIKRSVMTGPKSTKDELVTTFSREFGVPAVLLAQDARGQMEFYGRRDLSQWLANNVIDPSQLPWREFTLAA
jgi:hypothetical protein